MPPTEPPIVCDLSVLTDRERLRVEGIARARFAEVDALRELPDGYRIGFGEASPQLIADLAEFVALDRLCCPFLRHALVSEPGDTRIWLELTGPTGAAAAIAEDLLGLLPDDVRRAHGDPDAVLGGGGGVIG